MQTEADNFDDLIERLRLMSSADRKAVLARLRLDQRYSIEQALYGRKRTRQEEQRPSTVHKYWMFSPVLARMLDAIERGDKPQGIDGKALTPATCQVFAEAADTLCEASKKNRHVEGASLWDMFNKYLFPERAR